MNKKELMIVHCPERAMALELTRTIKCSRGQQEAMAGWEKHTTDTCYGIQLDSEPEVVFFGALDDDYLKNKTITAFIDWKTETVREHVKEQVFVYMCRGDIEDGCQARGIKVTKNRSVMEAKLIEAMIQEIISKEDTQ